MATDLLERVRNYEHPSFQEVSSWLDTIDDGMGEALVKRARDKHEPHLLRWVLERSVAQADAEEKITWPRPARMAFEALVRRGDERSSETSPADLLSEDLNGTPIGVRLARVADASAQSPEILQQELSSDVEERPFGDLYTAAVVRGAATTDAETTTRLLESAARDGRVLLAISENSKLMADEGILEAVANICLDTLGAIGEAGYLEGMDLMATATVLRRLLDRGWQAPAREMEYWLEEWRKTIPLGTTPISIAPMAYVLLHPKVPTPKEKLQEIIRNDYEWTLDPIEPRLLGDIADIWKQALEHPSLDTPMHDELLTVALKAISWNDTALRQTIGDEAFMHRHGFGRILDKLAWLLQRPDRRLEHIMPNLSGPNAWRLARRLAFDVNGGYRNAGRGLQTIIEHMTPEQLGHASDRDREMLAMSPDAKTRLTGILLQEQPALPDEPTEQKESIGMARSSTLAG